MFTLPYSPPLKGGEVFFFPLSGKGETVFSWFEGVTNYIMKNTQQILYT